VFFNELIITCHPRFRLPRGKAGGNDNQNMNVTALARKLRMTTSELFDVLPQLGFDIGRRAIKIDDRTANKIILNWPRYKRQLERMRVEEEQKKEEARMPQEKKKIKVPAAITARDFAAISGVSISKVLSELMKNGIFVSMNEKIDFDTAAIIGEDLNLEISLDQEAGGKKDQDSNKLKDIMSSQAEKDLQPRPPVIVVMGHVDHGKTKLLDAIRESNVVDKEAGGITQHIGAYQVKYKDKKITFIDTPGHEVFTAMRSRGAKVADIAVLVVAADDGVKPQTIEAYHIIEQAKLPFIVAINKIDKPAADIERTKNDLSSQLRIVPEEWGGKTICAEVSAKEKIGINEILDAILLVAEMNGDKIVANPKAPAVGTVIESNIDKGEGPVVTILIQNGTLLSGEIICLEDQPLGKIRIMKDCQGKGIAAALPGTPIRISGLKISPNIGDIIETSSGKKMRLNKVRKSANRQGGIAMSTAESKKDAAAKKINIIVRSDVLGSAEAIEESLEKLNTSEVKVKVIKKGLGNITEGDIDTALASEAVVVGFNVFISNAVQLLAREKKVEALNFKIIYELVDFIKNKMEASLGMEMIQKNLGKVKVLAIFKTEDKKQVVGGRVEEGKFENSGKIEVIRSGRSEAQGKIIGLQSGRQDVSEVAAGQECGIQYEGDPVIKVGDILRLYKERESKKKL